MNSKAEPGSKHGPPGAGRQFVRLRGRGAVSQPAGRFERWQRESDSVVGSERSEPDGDDQAPGIATRVIPDNARSLITYNRSPDLPFDRTINPYRGCEHGCSYCYARPYHAWLGHSPGLDFETLIYAKHDAAQLLRTELAAPSYRCATVHLGSATDAWQPVERNLKLTRGVLEVLAETRHPVTAITKSALIERDIDLLVSLARDRLAAVYVSITTLDPGLARAWEPRAAAPWRRLQTVRRLAEAGVPVGVAFAPIVPFLNEPEIERILEAASEAGASGAFYSVIRLPHEVEPVFIDWLQAFAPDRASRVLARIADLRTEDGERRLNDARFGSRFTGRGHWADLVAMRFGLAARRSGLGMHRFELDQGRFVAPMASGEQTASQMSLF